MLRGTFFGKNRARIVVRADTAGHPAVAKSCRIEERPQIRLVIFRLKDFGSRKPPRLVGPRRKRRSSQVALNLLQRGAHRLYALPLMQPAPMIEQSDATTRRYTAET